MTAAIYVDAAARARMVDWYRRFVEALDVPVERTEIATRVGTTEVISCGPPDAPPVVYLHAAFAGAPHALGQVQKLAQHARLIAPNVPGQSPAGPECRLEPSGESCSGWLRDVYDGMGLERASLMGVSMGGYVALRALDGMAPRIDRLVLMVPAGVVNAPVWGSLKRVGFSMLWHRLTGSQRSLDRVLSETFSDSHPLWDGYMREAMRAYRLDLTIPPLLSPNDVAQFRGPVLVYGAEHDASFPGAALVERARELFGDRVQTKVWMGANHCPPFSPAFTDELSRELAAFLIPGAPSPLGKAAPCGTADAQA